MHSRTTLNITSPAQSYTGKIRDKLVEKLFVPGSMTGLYGCGKKCGVTAAEPFNVYCHSAPGRINLVFGLRNETLHIAESSPATHLICPTIFNSVTTWIIPV
jgi:hypothetical protein